MKTSLITAAVALAALTIGLSLASCNVTVNPDGSKSANVDAAGLVRAIEVLNQK